MEINLAEIFLSIFIGMGPIKVLLVYLGATAEVSSDLQRRVAKKTIVTATTVALLLLAAGALFMRLLHFTPGAANIAGGIVLLLLALHMLISPGKTEHEEESNGRDPMQMAIYPLAVPYLLNPAGIAALVIASSEIDSIITGALIVGLVLLVGAIDFAIFRNMDKLARHLDPSRLVITEAVFGVLLAALAIQLMVDGLADLGIVSVVSH